MSRDVFPGYDDPVNIDGGPDDVLKLLWDDDVTIGADECG